MPDQLFTAVDDGLAGLLEIVTILERRSCTDYRQAVQRIGVEAVFDALQRLDQVGMPYREPYPQTCQRAGFGQGLGHQQVRVTIHQADCRLPAKVDVGFVDHHHRVRVGVEYLLDRFQRQQTTGRRIRVREDDAAIGSGVIGRLDLELCIQRYGLELDAVQPAIHRIKAVADVRKQQRLVVLKQAIEDMGQHFVRAVAQKHLTGLHAVIAGHRLLEQVAVRVRVQAQVVIELGLHGRKGFGRRAVRVFVGVELDQSGQFRLLARHVRHQVFNKRTPEFAHAYCPFLSAMMRYSALRAWPVNDSPRARTEAVLPNSEAPCSEQKMIDERFWKS